MSGTLRNLLAGVQTRLRQTRLAAWCCALAGLVGVVAAPARGQALFSPQCDVVLLAGLPGDVETENDYRDQLRTWLQIVGTSGRVRRVFVLCDAPESASLPAGVQGKVLRGDRAGFLGLGGELRGPRADAQGGEAAGGNGGSGQTHALVVIAWGHGGKQGNTPVLHVRGPRLTPADFKALAAESQAAESRWLLIFRGSGSFAAELAGQQRQILSSERDTSFDSDPAGMPVLLKLLRAHPAIPFEDLSARFGQAIDAWYKERNLARTEEPTWWDGQAQPRLLAAQGAESPGQGSGPDSGTGAANEPPAGSPVEDTAAAGLPPVWREIRRVSRDAYPDADGVILQRRVNYTLGSSPAVSSEHEEFIQILTPEGKPLGDFDISYSPPFEDIDFLDCEVLAPGGNLARLDPDAIREARQESLGDYQAGRRKFFSLPGVVPGAVLHVRYETRWSKFPLPHVSLEIPVGEDLPVVASTLEVSVPKDAPFHFAVENIAAADPTIRQGNYGTTYSWRFNHVPAHQSEILAPPNQEPRLMVSTFADWQDFADWYGRISQLTDEVTPEIAAKARELTRDARADRDKVLAVYNYVSGLRYVAVPLGVNSFRPHAAANVLENQFGDCKDKANLFNALLHAVNIDARLVLVPRFSQAHNEIPGLSFNHAISRVTLGQDTFWADTTDEVCRFGMLPPGDPGRKVLVIDGGSHALTQLPAARPGDHRLDLQGELTCSKPAEAMPVKLSVVGAGFPDYELRAAAREAKESRVAPPLLAAGFRPVAGAFALASQSASPVSALDRDFAWQAEGDWVGLCSGGAGKWLLRAPFWLPKEWDLALHRRSSGLFLHQGYPLILEEKFTLVLPAKAQATALPGLCEDEAGPLRWRIEWVRLSDDKLSARLHAELAQGELSTAEAAELQRQLRALMGALGAEAGFTAPE
jgi:transglutaminase-like putative cysteine protease